jgi:hypothetical protein
MRIAASPRQKTWLSRPAIWWRGGDDLLAEVDRADLIGRSTAKDRKHGPAIV